MNYHDLFIHVGAIGGCIVVIELIFRFVGSFLFGATIGAEITRSVLGGKK